MAVDHLGAEEDGLIEGTSRQLGTADPAGEAEVVADHRAGAGLPAHRRGLDERCAQSLRLGIHRRREAGGSAADDDEVVDPGSRAGACPQRTGELDVRGVDERAAVGQDDDRCAAGDDICGLKDRRAGFGASTREAERHALRAIGRAVATRGERVSAFYISNVESYLYREGAYGRFMTNLNVLPRDARSVMIRSIFGGASSTSAVQSMDETLAGK